MRPRALCKLLLTVVPLACLAGERYEGPIIDMHLHAQEEIWSERQLCFPQPCESPATVATSGAEVLAMTLAAMDEQGIVLGFLSGDAAIVDKWVAAAPERFIPSPTVFDPAESDLDALREDYRRHRFAGMGEIATQYAGYSPADEKVLPYFALAAEFDVPTLVHTLGNGALTPSFRVAMGDPRLLEEVIVRYPDLRLFNENCGFPFTDEMSAMMYQYPGLHCDISTILHLMPRKPALRHVRELIDRGLGKRIMYGSDQMIWPETIPVVIEAIQSAEFLSREQKADILYHNAARFLRLSEQARAAHRQ